MLSRFRLWLVPTDWSQDCVDPVCSTHAAPSVAMTAGGFRSCACLPPLLPLALLAIQLFMYSDLPLLVADMPSVHHGPGTQLPSSVMLDDESVRVRFCKSNCFDCLYRYPDT